MTATDRTEQPNLVGWLREQLDAEAQRAKWADTGHRWGAVRGEWGPGVEVTAGPDSPHWTREVQAEVWRCDDEEDGCPDSARAWMAEARHMATWDPARVLAEVEAKRRILDWAVRAIEVTEDDGYNLGCEDLIRLLAEPYAGNPGYREEWRP